MEKKTCLYDRHVTLGALMSPFGGFIMPIQYSNITDEHNAVRQHCGVFDVSHMGEVRITGPDAERYVQHIFTNDVTDAPLGQIYYGMMLYPNGGTVDDLLVYKMGENDFFLVINAANIDKDVAWMTEQTEGFDINLDHQSDYYGQLAVQGPEAEAVVEEVLGLPCQELKFYTAKTLEVAEAGKQLLADRQDGIGNLEAAQQLVHGQIAPEQEHEQHGDQHDVKPPVLGDRAPDMKPVMLLHIVSNYLFGVFMIGAADFVIDKIIRCFPLHQNPPFSSSRSLFTRRR